MNDTLSPRLAALARAVPADCLPVDVGTHHGALPVWLLVRRRVIRCFATELHPGGYQGPNDVPGLELRFGDGLDALDAADRPDVVLVSGLGARTMIGVLEHPRLEVSSPRRLVLQPQTEWGRLRRWLCDRGFGLVEEALVRDEGRDYLVLVAEPAVDAAAAYRDTALAKEDLFEAGPLLMRRPDPEVRRHWRERLVRAESILARATGSGRRRALDERDRARRVLAAVEPAL